jgi:hypothetical protein
LYQTKEQSCAVFTGRGVSRKLNKTVMCTAMIISHQRYLFILICTILQRIDGFFVGIASPAVPTIPNSPNGRDNDAIAAIKAAISLPKLLDFH